MKKGVIVVFVVSALVVLIVYQKNKERELILEDLNKHDNGFGHSPEGCNLFSGKWVFDEKSYPLYKEKQCSFVTDDYACERFGRKDFIYQNWRWQPHHCDLPRLNGTRMLESLRNQRLVYVGDSLGMNQWVSMVCLVESLVPTNLKSVKLGRHYHRFYAIEYNATIDFYWSPYLVESNCDDAWDHHDIDNPILRFQAIEKHGKQWSDANILIFDSYIWWRDHPKVKFLWGSFNSSNAIYKEVAMPRHFEMGLQTWSDWLEFHINRNKTQLFFMSLSPTHWWADEWRNGAVNKSCYGETKPIQKEGYHGRGSNPKAMQAVESAIEQLRTRGLNVQLLNITQLSEYRKDAHPSIYRNFWHTITQEKLANPHSYADCSHWCLPGVPDIWNQILYAYIFHYS